MISDVKYLQYMDQDTDLKLLQPEAVISKVNLRTNGKGNRGINVPILGTKNEISFSGNLKLLGWCQDISNKAVILFVSGQGGHAIYRYFIETGAVQYVYSAQWLNFDQNSIINADVVDGMLYWTDGVNQPRKINIDKALKMNDSNTKPLYKYSTLNPDMITVIKQPPLTSPLAQYKSETTINRNYIRGSLYQFRYQYVYDDDEESVWSPVSKVPLPPDEFSSSGTYYQPENQNNYIELTYNPGSSIVKKINFAYRKGNTGAWKRFHTVNRYNANGDLNNVSVNVSFWGNEVSYPLDQVETERLYHDVPLQAVHQRFINGTNLVYANYYSGYSNITGSVGLTVNTGIYTGEFDFVKDEVTRWVIDFNRLRPSDTAYVRFQMMDTWGADPRTYEFTEEYGTDMTYNEFLQACVDEINDNEQWQAPVATIANGIIYVAKQSQFPVSITYLTVTYTGTIYTQPKKTFKAGSNVEVGVVYYDAHNRSCGVQAASNVYVKYHTEEFHALSFDTPTIHTHNIQVDLSSITPPEWAVNYQVLVSPKRKSFFQFLVPPFSLKDGFVKIDLNQSIDIALSQNSKYAYGYYVFNKGDRVRIVGRKFNEFGFQYTSKYYDMEIVGVGWPTGEDGYETDDAGNDIAYIVDENGNKIRRKKAEYLLVPNFNFEAEGLGNDSVLIEVYTPEVADDENNAFFEVGECYPITQDRKHSQENIVLDGDVYVKSRRVVLDYFVCEASNFSDTYQSAVWDKGRPNIYIENAEGKWYPNYLKHSKKYIKSSINGLSDFDASSEVLSSKYGEITGLHETGYILRVNQEIKNTSIYIGRVVFNQADGQSGQVGTTSNLIGTIMPSQLDFGTVFPMSVVTNGTHQYMFDVFNGVVIRDSYNGPHPISNYGMSSFFKEISRKIMAQGIDTVRVVGGWDGENEELSLTFVLSGEQHTVVFHEPSNKWSHFCTMIPDMYMWFGDVMLTYKNGNLWRHNVTGSSTIYNGQIATEVEFVANAVPMKNKIFQNIQIQASSAPSAEVEIIEEGVKTMESVLYPTDFRKKQETLWANFRRNGTTPYELVNGSRLRGRVAKIKLSGTGEISYAVVNSITSEKS